MEWSAADMLLLGADVDEFRLEKNIKPEKPLEEIEKLYVDENLSHFDRTCKLASSSFDIQKIWALEQLPFLLKNEKQQTITRLLPKLMDSLQTNNIELHKVGSQVFSTVATKELVDSVVFVSTFLTAILTHFENKNIAISNLWLETLMTSISVLPRDILKHKIMNIARSRGQLSQSVSSRQTCCHIIGKMANNSDPFWVKQELLPLVKTLSRDVDHNVRETMCGQLPHIARSLSREFSTGYVLPEIEELMKDEEVVVRSAAIESLVELVSFLEESCLKEKVVPLVLKCLNEAVSKNEGKGIRMRVKCSQLIGRLSYELKGYFSVDNSYYILDVLNKLSKTPNVSSLPSEEDNMSSSNIVRRQSYTPAIEDDQGAECRRLCAFNIPAMMLFADHLKETSKVIEIVRLLSADQHDKVRRTLACGFHEVVSILGDKSHVITKDLGTLLQDNNPDVLLALLEHFPEIIDNFIQAHNLDIKTRQPGLLELIQPLLHLEQVASTSRQWRLHCMYLENMSCLAYCMTSDQLYYKFVPLCWKCISKNVPPITSECQSTTYSLPIKLAASRTLCSFIKSIKRADQRREICSQFITDCARSDSHKQRLLFINICCIILDSFSRNFFKEYGFYSALLNLANDSSVNIRLKLSTILPRLKTILLLPTDREYQQQFESAISTLLMDHDSETLAAVHEAVKDMDKLNYRMQSMIAHSLLEEDIIDKEREEEEQQLLRDEEELEREKDGGSNTRLAPDYRRAVPNVRAGLQSPNNSSRAAVVKKQSINKRSPSVPRKGSNLAMAASASPNTNRPVVTKTSPMTAGGNKKRRNSSGNSTPEAIRKTLTSHIDHSPSDLLFSSSHIEDTSKGKHTGQSLMAGRRSTGSSPSLNVPSRNITTTKSKDHLASQLSNAASASKNSSPNTSLNKKSNYGIYSAKK